MRARASIKSNRRSLVTRARSGRIVAWPSHVLNVLECTCLTPSPLFLRIAGAGGTFLILLILIQWLFQFTNFNVRSTVSSLVNKLHSLSPLPRRTATLLTFTLHPTFPPLKSQAPNFLLVSTGFIE